MSGNWANTFVELKHFFENNKPVESICHGQHILAVAGVPKVLLLLQTQKKHCIQ